MQLKQMGMARPDSNPDYFCDSFWRESADAFNRKEECAKLDRAEFFAQGGLNVFADFGKKTEGEVQLIHGGPSNAFNVWIQRHQNIPDRFWRIDRDKQPAQFHFRALIARPLRASLPSWLTRPGSPRLINLITQAERFGKTALAAIAK